MDFLEAIEPAFYSPWTKGFYDVSPNLKPLGTDFGNGRLDQGAFQFDRSWRAYAHSKESALRENPLKYRGRVDLSRQVEAAASAWMCDRLVQEWPEVVERSAGGVHFLHTGSESGADLDAIATNLQEDLAIVTRREDSDCIAYINVCNPSHWRPVEKIGGSFFDAHVPVPGFDKINAKASALVDVIVTRGPFVRFVWGLESDDRLNHHPDAPDGTDQGEWYGRRFEAGLFVRVERQVLCPLPQVDAALFLIRPIVYPLDVVRSRPGSWDLLKQVVQSMDEASLAYKGIPQGLLSV